MLEVVQQIFEDANKSYKVLKINKLQSFFSNSKEYILEIIKCFCGKLKNKYD